VAESVATRADVAPDPRAGLRGVARVSASLVGTFAVTNALGLVFWLVAARQFTVGAVGVAGASVFAMMLLGALGTGGLGTLLVAHLPVTERTARRLLVRTSLAVAALGGGLLAVLVPLVAVEGLGAEGLRAVAGRPGTAALFALGTALMSVSVVVDQAALVVGHGGLQLERNTVASVVKLVALVALAAAGASGGTAVFAAWVVGLAVSLPVVGWRTRRRGPGRGPRTDPAGRRLVDPRVLRGLGRRALSHHALNTALLVPLQLLPVLALVGVSAQATGIFSTALQVSGVVFALPFAIATALFASAAGREQDVVARMRVTLPVSLAISVAGNLALVPLAGVVLGLFGSAYSAQGVEVLRLLALAGLPFVVKDHLVALRRVQGRTGEATVVLVALGALELAAATVGVTTGGVVGMCAWWLGALVVEAVVLAVPLVRAVRRRAGPARASS
jgi:O-antigen/teichoic acid export membrane protein